MTQLSSVRLFSRFYHFATVTQNGNKAFINSRVQRMLHIQTTLGTLVSNVSLSKRCRGTSTCRLKANDGEATKEIG